MRLLLSLDERDRPSTKDALKHEWFTNSAHKTDFEEVYQRAVKHWRPRIPKLPVIELLDAEGLKDMSFLQETNPSNPRGRRRGPTPIDPPYKPFPRRLTSAFFPKRRTSPFSNMMTEDIKSAIRSNWTFEKSFKDVLDASSEEDDLLPPCASEPDYEKTRLTMPSVVTTEPTMHAATIDVPRTPPPRRQSFQPLLPTTTSIEGVNPGEEDQRTSQTQDLEDSQTASSRPPRRGTSVTKPLSPSARGRASLITDGEPKSKAPITLACMPITPKMPQILGRNECGATSSVLPSSNAKTSRTSGYFAWNGFSGSTTEDKQLIAPTHHGPLSLRDQAFLPKVRPTVTTIEDCSGEYAEQRPATCARGIGVVLPTNPKILEPIANTTTATSNKEQILRGAQGKFSMTAELKLKSPGVVIGDSGTNGWIRTKKRRRNSIFDFEKDPVVASTVQKLQGTDRENAICNDEQIASTRVLHPQSAEWGQTRVVGITDVATQSALKSQLYLPRI